MLCLTACGPFAFSGGFDGVVRCWVPDQQDRLRLVSEVEPGGGAVFWLASRALEDGSVLLCAGSRDRRVRSWVIDDPARPDRTRRKRQRGWEILGVKPPANDLLQQQPRSCWLNSNHGLGVRDALPPPQCRDLARNRGFCFEILSFFAEILFQKIICSLCANVCKSRSDIYKDVPK